MGGIFLRGGEGEGGSSLKRREGKSSGGVFFRRGEGGIFLRGGGGVFFRRGKGGIFLRGRGVFFRRGEDGIFLRGAGGIFFRRGEGESSWGDLLKGGKGCLLGAGSAFLGGRGGLL